MRTTIGKDRAMALVQFLAELYPRWKATPTLLGVVRDDVSKSTLDEEQIRAIFSASIRTARSGTPDMRGIHALMADAVRQQETSESGQSRRVEIVDGPRISAAEMKEIRRRNQEWDDSPHVSQEAKDRVNAAMERMYGKPRVRKASS